MSNPKLPMSSSVLNICRLPLHKEQGRESEQQQPVTAHAKEAASTSALDLRNQPLNLLVQIPIRAAGPIAFIRGARRLRIRKLSKLPASLHDGLCHLHELRL